MRVSRILTTVIGVLLVISVCVAAEAAGNSEVLPKICSDLSYCQIIEEDGPVPQSSGSVSSLAGLSRIGMRTLDWLSSLGLLVPVIGA